MLTTLPFQDGESSRFKNREILMEKRLLFTPAGEGSLLSESTAMLPPTEGYFPPRVREEAVGSKSSAPIHCTCCVMRIKILGKVNVSGCLYGRQGVSTGASFKL